MYERELNNVGELNNVHNKYTYHSWLVCFRIFQFSIMIYNSKNKTISMKAPNKVPYLSNYLYL